MVHLFVVCGNQGRRRIADQLLLTDKLLQAVLAEAQVVCIGQPLLIAGDLNADLAVNPCLTKGISAGRYVDLALFHSLGLVLLLLLPVGLLLRVVRVRVGIFLSAVPTHCLLCLVVCQPIWPASRLDTPDRSSSSTTRVVQDVWDLYMRSLVWLQRRLCLLLGMRSPGLLWMIFGLLGVITPSPVYFRLIVRLVVPLGLAALPFLEEVCHVFVVGVWEVELFAAGDLVGYIGSVMVMRSMCIVLSTLSSLAPVVLFRS